MPSLRHYSGGLARKVSAQNDLFGLGGCCCIEELDSVVETEGLRRKTSSTFVGSLNITQNVSNISKGIRKHWSVCASCTRKEEAGKLRWLQDIA
jgi:hypothetical protein